MHSGEFYRRTPWSYLRRELVSSARRLGGLHQGSSETGERAQQGQMVVKHDHVSKAMSSTGSQERNPEIGYLIIVMTHFVRSEASPSGGHCVLLLSILAWPPYSPADRGQAWALGGIYLCNFCDSQDYGPEEVPSQELRLTKTHPAHASSSR